MPSPQVDGMGYHGVLIDLAIAGVVGFYCPTESYTVLGGGAHVKDRRLISASQSLGA